MTMICIRAAAAIAALAAVASATGQAAREGRIDTALCWGGPLHLLSPNANDRFGTYVVTGGARAAEGPIDAMALECIGSFESRGGTYRHQGYCVYQNAAGDKVYASDTTDAQGYSWQFLGGTGRFEGIVGNGTVERLGNLTPVRQGTLQGCRRMVGHFKLP